jgi:thiamine transport system permease protein
MAQRAGAMTRAAAPAYLAGAILLAVVLGPLPLLLSRGQVTLTGADFAALRFTVMQAGLSALLSCLLAVPVARALHRRRFVGRGAMIALMGAPFLLPVIVAALGIVSIWGARGWLARMGLPLPSLYGLQGVLLAHVFLNLPLATRMLLQGWQAIPAERTRLGESLGFDPWARFRHLEWPMLRSVLPGAMLAVFLVCLTSFAIVLTLGGGPKATTLELAIYQAVRFDFDLPRAAALALLQFGVCGLAVAASARLVRDAGFGAGLDRSLAPPAPAGWRRGLDGFLLLLTAAFLLLPLSAITLNGLLGLPEMPAQVWPALARSLIVAVTCGILSTVMALALALAVAKGLRGLEYMAMLPLAASSMVLGIGLFLAVQPFAPPAALALPVTLLVNIVLALPYAFRLILPEARALQADYGRLAEALDMRGLVRLRLLTLPRLRRPLGLSAGLAAALAMGDLGAIALFASEGGATLPLLIQRLMGAYRIEAAAGAALVLMVANFGLFWLFDRWGRHAAV